MKNILAVGCVLIHEKKILLSKRRKPPNQDMWTIPGGKVHAGESLFVAAKREAQEELGIDCEALEVCHVFELEFLEQKLRYIIVDIHMRYNGDAIRLNSEASAFGWFCKSELNNCAIDNESKQLALKMLS
ncbi:MAG: NUDIX domain-containing protein [Gammaproteobacteria bacterium]|nr:NUDIX domain-containing protein [Gammaproteobacteria bacterium]